MKCASVPTKSVFFSLQKRRPLKQVRASCYHVRGANENWRFRVSSNDRTNFCDAFRGGKKSVCSQTITWIISATMSQVHRPQVWIKSAPTRKMNYKHGRSCYMTGAKNCNVWTANAAHGCWCVSYAGGTMHNDFKNEAGTSNITFH